MRHLYIPDSLQTKIVKAYQRALRDVTDARAVPENHIRASAALSREVFDLAVSELLANDAAGKFAQMFAPVACTRRGCGNDAAFTDSTLFEEPWCSRACRQWERRIRVRERRAAERAELVAA